MVDIRVDGYCESVPRIVRPSISSEGNEWTTTTTTTTCSNNHPIVMMNNNGDDPALEEHFRYALHETTAGNNDAPLSGGDDDPSLASRISNDTPVPTTRFWNAHRIVRSRTTGTENGTHGNGGPSLYWHPLPGILRVPTLATWQQWSIRWFYESAWPGMGLFGESYLLFSTGLLKPIWETLFPECFAYETCTPHLIRSLTYSVVIGIIVGMIVLGYLAKYIGRRKGSMVTATLMTGGAIGMVLMTFVLESRPSWLFRSQSMLLFVLGIGVGGEYPLSASLAAEKSMQASLLNNNSNNNNHHRPTMDAEQERGMELATIRESPERRSTSSPLIQPQIQNHHDHIAASSLSPRGRQIQMVFTMQGVGIWSNSITMTILILLTGQSQVSVAGNANNDNNYSAAALLATWRITHGLGACILVGVWISRYYYLKESVVWADDQHRRNELLLPPSPPSVSSPPPMERAPSDKLIVRDGDATSSPSIPQPSTTSPPPTPSSPQPTVRTDMLLPNQHQQPNNNNSCSNSNSNSNTLPANQGDQEQQPIPELKPSLSNVSSLSSPSAAADAWDGFFQHYDRGGRSNTWDTESNDDGDDNDDNHKRSRSSFALLRRYYGMRLLGTSLSWLLWDVAFYGNKLFQSTFLLALTGRDETNLLDFCLAATFNSTVALVGYVLAGYLLDHPSLGRIRLQGGGFLLTGFLFLVCGFTRGKTSTTWSILLYLASSLVGQAPNATTFLVPAEIFPTEMRTLSHGIAAASGKVGALLAAVGFNYIHKELYLFLACGYACFFAALVTVWALPESSDLDMVELDQQWRMTLAGKRKLYQGPANHPRHWSMYELWIANRRQKGFDNGDGVIHGLS